MEKNLNDNDFDSGIFNETDFIIEGLDDDAKELVKSDLLSRKSETSTLDMLYTYKMIEESPEKESMLRLVSAAPAFLLASKIVKTYQELSKRGFDDKTIIRIFCSSFKSVARINTPVVDNRNEYFDLSRKTLAMIEKGEVSLETDKIKVKKIMNDHQELLRRLR